MHLLCQIHKKHHVATKIGLPKPLRVIEDQYKNLQVLKILATVFVYKGSELERVTMFFSFFGTRRAEPNCNKGKSKIHRNPEGLGRERNRTKLPYPIPLRGLRRID
jgi:hypothetical protein